MKRLVDVVQVLALLAAAVTVIALFANEPDDATPATATATATGESPDGADVYAASCASCHGPDGGGGVGPALGGGAVVDSYPDEADQVAVITDGRGGMPAFGDALSAEEIQAVTSYTRNDL
jgi:mono/diheme cytochrome c family protein